MFLSDRPRRRLADGLIRLMLDGRLWLRLRLGLVPDGIRAADVIERTCRNATDRACLFFSNVADLLLCSLLFPRAPELLFSIARLVLVLTATLPLGALLLPHAFLISLLPLLLLDGAHPLLLLALGLPLELALLLGLPLLVGLALAVFARAALLLLASPLFLVLPVAMLLLAVLAVLLLVLLPVALLGLPARLLLLRLVVLVIGSLDVRKRTRGRGPRRRRWRQQRRTQRDTPPSTELLFHRVPFATH